MCKELVFDKEKYTVETVTMEGQTLVYRAYENIPYVSNPVDEKMERLSIFVPEVFYEGKEVGGYNLGNAPIFLPNTIGGYMPGPQERPGKNIHGKVNATFFALLHGYVVVSAGARGREMKDEAGKYLGCAPAALCDLKAAIRFLRHNAENIPGDVDKIISNGTSAGGAMSSLLGSTGNHPDYESYLEKLGAAKESDAIFAASCYCPITNLDHADMAYEWEFCGLNEFSKKIEIPPQEGESNPTFIVDEGTMTEEQQKMAEALKKMFSAYVNGLGLKDTDGKALELDGNGNGSFKEYVLSYVKKCVQKEYDKGTDLSELDWMTIENDVVTDVDFDKYIRFRTRMKATPAFDNVSMGTPENELFGTSDMKYRHFTDFSKKHSTVNGELADELQIKMMNPMNYIGDDKAVKAEHFRIRHGAVDRDTSLSISAKLTASLENHGVDVELDYPWGMPHAGDYDLEELFAWIDKICE